MEEPLHMRILSVEKGVPVFELMKGFPGYSCAAIFRHMKRPVIVQQMRKNSIREDQKKFHSGMSKTLGDRSAG